MSQYAKVFVVDGDPRGRYAVTSAGHAMGVGAIALETAEAFLALGGDLPGCIVTEYRLSGANGVELQKQLQSRGCISPFILAVSSARTSLVVRAMKAGALTVLEKPYQEEELWEAIRDGVAKDAELRGRRQRHAESRRRLASLSANEQVVLEQVARGKQNKAIAAMLGVSLRTIENRRRSVLAKLGVGSVAELVALKLSAESSSAVAPC